MPLLLFGLFVSLGVTFRVPTGQVLFLAVLVQDLVFRNHQYSMVVEKATGESHPEAEWLVDVKRA